MVIELKTKQWGNSIGIVIPTEIIKEMKIKIGEEIKISIDKKENPLKELFGALKFNKSTEQILKETREDMKSKWIN